MNMHVKAVLFDLGGTLIKTAEIPRIYKRILKAHGIMISAEKIAKAHRENEKNVDVVEGQAKHGRDFWMKWNSRILESLGIEENVEFLARKIDELWWDCADLELYPDVIPTLRRLKAKGIITGIVTNGLESDYQRILQKLRLTNSFEVVVGVDSCGKGKPSREIFDCALDRLHISPDEAIFVGDSIRCDYEGAKNAGIRPVLINREGNETRAKSIRNLNDVMGYL
jgi:putative hydrolase of the HAD superfamily